MLDRERLKAVQRILFGRGTGKTTAIVATALQVAYRDRKEVQVVAHNHTLVAPLREIGMMLAHELNIPIEEEQRDKIKLGVEGNIFVYFVSRRNIFQNMYKTFYDHDILISLNVDVDLDTLLD